MTPTKTVSIDAMQLRATFEFVSSGAPFEYNAYICRDTGKIYWETGSGGLDEEDDLPEDFETSDQYIEVRHKNELGLGSGLALAFVDQELPDDFDTVSGFFGGAGRIAVQGFAERTRRAAAVVRIRRTGGGTGLARVARGEWDSPC